MKASVTSATLFPTIRMQIKDGQLTNLSFTNSNLERTG